MVNDGDYFMNAVAKPLQRSKDIFVFFRFVGILHQQNFLSLVNDSWNSLDW